MVMQQYTGPLMMMFMLKAVMGMFTYAMTEEPYHPAIPGFAFHNTSHQNALKILEDGCLIPFIGSISFTLDPCFTVADPGVTFVFPEHVIREKYSGKEPEFRYIPDPEARRKAWESEMEVEVKHQRVYMSDCVEVLAGRDTCWKYGYGYKYRYIDVRDRKYGPWRKFNRDD